MKVYVLILLALTAIGCGADELGDLDADGCITKGQCPASAPICDVGGTGRCVECTSSDAQLCGAAEPICGDDNVCRGCTAHSECADSSACTPTGQCAAPSEVAYVAAGGTGTTAAGCSKGAACPTLADAVATPKPYIKIATGLVQDDQTTIVARVVTILAEAGSKLASTGSGAILEVRGNGTDVKIFDLEINGASGSADSIGILAPTGSPMLTLSRVVVIGNAGGGIKIDGAQFDITNSVIAKNGSAGSTLGGISLSGIVGPGTYRLDFNTISANLAPATVHTGIACGTVLAPLVFSNNIVYANLVSGSGRQVGGSANCTMMYSDVGPDAFPGAGNINMDPMFVRPTQNDFHLSGASPAKDAADPAAEIDRDIDGDARPQGGRYDMGADEIKL